MMTGISKRSLLNRSNAPVPSGTMYSNGTQSTGDAKKLKHPFFLPSVFALIALVTLVLYDAKLANDARTIRTSSEHQEAKVKNRKFLSSTKHYYEEENRCYERDDPEEWKEIPRKRDCACPDPVEATDELRTLQPEWKVHHQTMVNDVLYETSIDQTIPLDIVFLGDSITERWNGTRRMGTETNFPEFRQSFDSMFNKRTVSTAKLQGLLLGSAGDITVELLWHIHNGIIIQHLLQPKVFMILIGTNDLGRMECSGRTVLGGILNLANYLKYLYPKTPIIVHGLLPRADTYNKGNYHLGRYWRDIHKINTELEKMCKKRALCHYMDATDIFVTEVVSGNSTFLMIDETVMSDSLHPDVTGYNLWGQQLVDKILQTISLKK